MAKTDLQCLNPALPVPPCVCSLCPCLSCPSGSTGAARHGGSSAKAGCAPVSEDATPRGSPNLAAADVHLSSLLNEGRAPSTPVFPQRCSGVAGEERQKALGGGGVGEEQSNGCTGRSKKKGELLFRPQGRRGRRRVHDGN